MALILDSGSICPQHWRNGAWQKTGDINPLPVETFIWNGSTWVPVSGTAPLPISAAPSQVQDVTFLDAVTSPGQGTFTVGGYKTLTVEIYGTSTSRTVNFKATLASGAQIPITGVNLSSMSTGTSTSGTGEIWQFDVTGLNTVIMDLSAVSGGTVSIKGKAVV